MAGSSLDSGTAISRFKSGSKMACWCWGLAEVCNTRLQKIPISFSIHKTTNPTTSIICFLLTPWSEVKSATVGLFYPVAAFQWWIGAGVSGSGFVTPNCVHPLALAGDLSACAVSFPPASLVNTGSTSLSLVPWLIINSQSPTHIPSTTTLALLSIPEPYNTAIPVSHHSIC